MTDHYTTLGVSETATPEEIKKAYRSLANRHHPDKGGDQAVFKDISVAYDTLSDASKKADYDNQRKFGGGGGHRFHTGNMNDFADIFGGGFDPFGHRSNPFGDMFGRRMQRNRDLNIHCQITLLDSFIGKQLEANYKLPSGKMQTVVINVPAGVVNGDTIRYNGLGDDTISQVPRGNLNVTIVVLPDRDGVFERRGDDLYTSVDITPIEAMIGCRKTIKSINGSTIDLEIRAGVETGIEFASHGTGFTNVNSGRKGRFVTVVKVKSMAVTDPAIVEQLKTLQEAIKAQSK